MNILQKISERAAEAPSLPLVLLAALLVAATGVLVFWNGCRAETKSPDAIGNGDLAAAERIGGAVAIVAAVAVSALAIG